MNFQKVVKKIKAFLLIFPLIVIVFFGMLIQMYNKLFKQNIPWQQISLRLWKVFAELKPIRFSGDQILPRDRAIIICNHFSDADFVYAIYTIDKFAPKRMMQLCMKKEVSKLPLVSLWTKMTKSSIISRVNAEKDTKSILQMSKGDGIPVIFVEGRVLNKDTLQWADLRRKDLNLPKADHVLIPQPRGLHTLLSSGKYNIIYDMTLSYEGYKGGIHDFEKASTISCKHWLNKEVSGCVHVDLKRLQLNDTQNISLEDCTDFLNSRWMIKNAKLQYFIEHNEFPDDHFEDQFYVPVNA